MLKYREYQVNNKLAVFIKKLWVLDNMDNAFEVPDKSVLPNGCFTIAFIEGRGLQVKTKKADVFLKPGVYFCGQITEAITVNILQHSKATMAQLFAWVPAHFTNLDMSQFTDLIIPLDDTGIRLSENQANQNNYTNRQIIKFLHTNFKGLFNKDTTPLVINSCKLILDSKGEIGVAEICKKLNCSSRYLQKKFSAHIGLSPKEFAIIIKLRNAVDDIAYPADDTIRLTQLALMNNFYDQAHFNNTFQTIVKTSPRKFNVPDYLLSLKK
ncbi:AraC-like DNA-binding protein [Mucilaginibacter frigoritolerans]|jgi:AraC-like DNA-binding protein|uniref:AraC-like DNA-binding protein n=1 Tax=Mucilaginibacter frigoritolerans TaxID=652788 RepID=A0A562U2L0_9SPHI|nr:helix-turn-helix transcriptional regulator [Mucilaginibacter frigoritolerans]TWI99340.1 AraC-like DNA-binding protein [Mucilaginibacter frigoritolerans]